MGKAAKKRHCPALDRTITPADCGENRNSRYRCPGDCVHNPFAPENYGQLLEIEGALDEKSFRRLVEDSADPDALAAAARAAMTRDSSGVGMHALVVWEMFFRRDGADLTCAQRWECAGFPGLKNDERALFRAKMQTRVVLWELQRVIDDQTVDAVDLLAVDPTPVRLVDRSLASTAVRFSPMLCWTYPMPHFWRISGNTPAVPEMGPFEPRQILLEIVRHLGGPEEIEPLRAWLAANFERVSDSIAATAHERRRRMFASIDFQQGVATYDLQAPFPECRAQLDAAPQIAPTEPEASERTEGFAEARTWFDDGDTGRPADAVMGRPILGTALLGRAAWRLQASGAARLAKLRERFEGRMGKLVRFSRERRDDIAAQLAAKEPAGDAQLVPPALLEHIGGVSIETSQIDLPAIASSRDALAAEVRQHRYQTFADEPVPALDNQTPRAAARDPALRPRLIHLMKMHVRGIDEENLREGRSDDINWLLRDLGLHEIDVPPPPPRARLPSFDDDDLDPGENDDLFQPAFRPRGMDHDLPDRPLTIAEAESRVQCAVDVFDTAAAAMDEMEATGCTLIDDIDALTEDLLNDDEFSQLIPYLIIVWFALVPRGRAAPELDLTAMEVALSAEVDRILESLAGSAKDQVESLLGHSRQRALAEILLDRLLSSMSLMPKKLRAREESQALMVMLLKVVIDEVDAAVRGQDP